MAKNTSEKIAVKCEGNRTTLSRWPASVEEKADIEKQRNKQKVKQ